MERNFISEYIGTHFYVDLIEKTYGVCINVKDLNKKEEIINKFKEDRKDQINAWKKEWGVEYGI